MPEPKKPVQWIATMGLRIEKTGEYLKAGDPFPGNPAKWLKEQGKVVKADG